MADSGTFAVLNLGSQRVSGAVFSRNRSGELLLRQIEFIEMHGDPGAEATRLPQLRVAVLELADKLKLKGRKVWYAIAGHVVFTRFVKLPPFQDDKADQIVEFEARQNVPFPINEVIWDYEFIGTNTGPEREVVLVAIKADALNDINDQIESNGVAVAGVDLAPLALYNAVRYTHPDVEGPALIVDLGAKSTNLVFVEGKRLFTRNILSGGSTVTGAIAKELGIPFGEAEEQKRTRGFIAPGGAHEPHEDEAVNAISKIMRNSMTRLHGEIVRTINYYRSQQGGSAPKQIFLAGGGAAAALATEFFAEKFNLPVEVLNPLRGIQVDARCESLARTNAPAAGELVGLALRHAGAVPVEVELTPDSVERARDSARRMPALILAMLSLFALMGTGIFFFKQAAGVVRTKAEGLASTQADLKRHDDALKNIARQLETVRGQSVQLEDAVKGRAFWKNLCALLNRKFSTDYVWITQMELLKNGNSLTPSLSGSSTQAAAVPAPAAPTPAKGAAAVSAEPLFELRLQGLYRDNKEGQQQVVYKYFEDLMADKDAEEIFAPTDKKPEVDAGLADRYAYKFNHRLPLQPGVMKFEK
jgi:type IV pilus assembly protein PilM